MSTSPPVITFLSDYDHTDEFVGVCHSVIARRCPAAHVIDITHRIPRHDVRTGALTLANCMQFTPVGVHLAIVDPGVGAIGAHSRRAVALRTAAEGRLLVGPDNGLLALAAQRAGGVVEAVDIGRSPERLEPVSSTFHGRDIFAPVAAALADGLSPAAVGDPIATDDLHTIELPETFIRDQDGATVLVSHVLGVDTFGNVTLDAAHADLASIHLRLGETVAIETPTGQIHDARYAVTFADVPPGRLLLYEDANRLTAIAVNRASAAQILAVAADDELHLTGP